MTQRATILATLVASLGLGCSHLDDLESGVARVQPVEGHDAGQDAGGFDPLGKPRQQPLDAGGFIDGSRSDAVRPVDAPPSGDLTNPTDFSTDASAPITSVDGSLMRTDDGGLVRVGDGGFDTCQTFYMDAKLNASGVVLSSQDDLDPDLPDLQYKLRLLVPGPYMSVVDITSHGRGIEDEDDELEWEKKEQIPGLGTVYETVVSLREGENTISTTCTRTVVYVEASRCEFRLRAPNLTEVEAQQFLVLGREDDLALDQPGAQSSLVLEALTADCSAAALMPLRDDWLPSNATRLKPGENTVPFTIPRVGPQTSYLLVLDSMGHTQTVLIHAYYQTCLAEEVLCYDPVADDVHCAKDWKTNVAACGKECQPCRTASDPNAAAQCVEGSCTIWCNAGYTLTPEGCRKSG